MTNPTIQKIKSHYLLAEDLVNRIRHLENQMDSFRQFGLDVVMEDVEDLKLHICFARKIKKPEAKSINSEGLEIQVMGIELKDLQNVKSIQDLYKLSKNKMEGENDVEEVEEVVMLEDVYDARIGLKMLSIIQSDFEMELLNLTAELEKVYSNLK